MIHPIATCDDQGWAGFSSTHALRWLPQVFVSVPACIQLLEGPYLETNNAIVKAFRPVGLVRVCKKDSA